MRGKRRPQLPNGRRPVVVLHEWQVERRVCLPGVSPLRVVVAGARTDLSWDAWGPGVRVPGVPGYRAPCPGGPDRGAAGRYRDVPRVLGSVSRGGYPGTRREGAVPGGSSVTSSLTGKPTSPRSLPRVLVAAGARLRDTRVCRFAGAHVQAACRKVSRVLRSLGCAPWAAPVGSTSGSCASAHSPCGVVVGLAPTSLRLVTVCRGW